MPVERTKEELLQRFREERYVFKAPPVCPNLWSDWDWCRFIMSYKGFGDVILKEEKK
jgi:hypothetical protein